MWLKRLVLKNFRNYKSADISFCPCANMIFGHNAQGKTNILEAISLLSTGRSFRTRNLSDAITSGADHFFLQAYFEKEGVDQTLSIFFDGQNKKIQHNETSYQSFLSLLGILPSVFIVPEDIALIIGSPSERRKFLDMHIAQMDPLYVYYLGRYYKAMKQRNALLKQHSETAISSWEQIMAQAASYITHERKKHIDDLLPISSHIMQKLSRGKDALSLYFKASVDHLGTLSDLENRYAKLFANSRKKEMVFGSTLNGPHKDDIEIQISERAAKYFGSEGQKRCALAALLLAQRQAIKEKTSCSPIVGIDDFGAHFDEERNKELIHLIQLEGQTFLTSPFCSGNWDLSNQREYLVENGSIRVNSPQYA